MLMAHGGKYRGPSGRNGRYDGPAYGNSDSWHDDDFRVAVIVLLMATVWIVVAFRRRQEGNKGWFERLGIGFGNSSAPGFTR